MGSVRVNLSEDKTNVELTFVKDSGEEVVGVLTGHGAEELGDLLFKTGRRVVTEPA